MFSKQSLTRTTIIKMGIRIAIITIIVTLVSYWHVMSNLELQVVGQLEKYIIERGQYESTLFKLAEDNHAELKKELLWQLEKLGEQDPQAEFDRLFVRSPDGVIRNRPELFDGTRQAGVYIDEMLTINADIRRRILTFYELTALYGKAWHNRFQTTYITTPENIAALYWPELPTWAQDATTDLYMPDEEYLWIADKKHNPKRESAWTGLFYDAVSKTWMVSCETPVDIADRHIATIGHDIFLNELLNRTITDHIEGTHNIIFREDGRLIAHPQYMTQIMDAGSDFNILKSDNEHLLNIFKAVKSLPADTVIIENGQNNEYLAVTKIEGPDWYFVAVYPKSLLAELAFDTARFILLLGIISLFIEVTILQLILWRQVARPLQDLLDATKQIAAGNFNIEATQHLPLNRRDEIGELANSFNSMASHLKASFDTLDAKVIERTAQLDDKIVELIQTRQKLVESEKMASLGGLVAGVAHEINTPIGIGVTAASTLADRTAETTTAYDNKQLKGSALKAYFNMAQVSSNLVLNNLNRAAELIQSFKQVAVEQSNLDKRSFAVKKYIMGTLINLKSQHQITVNGDEQIEINSYPGAFSQIITNLVMNSVRHAYPKFDAGNLHFELKLDSGRLMVEYSDDGCGIPTKNRDKIFEPFFTTARAQGGTGLGLHIVFNLVTQKLQGTINVQSEVGVGTTFILNLPLNTES